jgi:hypothetical protein
MTEKIAILAGDLVARSGTTVTASSTASATVPASNVQNMRPGKAWRATGAAGETLTFDFGEASDVSAVAIVGHNGSLDGVWRVELSDASDFSVLVADSGELEMWPPVYGLGEGGFGDYLGGYVDPSELGVFVALSVWRAGAVYEARYMRLTLTDTGSPIGAVQVGAVLAGRELSFERNFAHGWTWDEVDLSQQVRTEAGGVIVQEAPVFPRLSFTLPALSKAEALTDVQTLRRAIGRRKPVLVMLAPDAEPARFYRQTIYGLISEASGIQFPRADRAVQAFTVDGLV